LLDRMSSVKIMLGKGVFFAVFVLHAVR